MVEKLQIPTRESVASLLNDAQPPCISLYQSTHRYFPESQQDSVRFRNQLTRLEENLNGNYPELNKKKLLEPFYDLADDREFWNHTLDGIAVLGSPNVFRAFTIPRMVKEIVVVADSFHRKPLRKFLQSTDQYQLLGLSLDEIELYQASRNSLEKINTGPEVPKTASAALGRQIETDHPAPQPFATVRSGTRVVNYGHGGGKDEREIDAERFFRAVDTAVIEHVSKRSKLPLMLVALAEHHTPFQQLSQNPFLLSKGVVINPKAVKEGDLKDMAWNIMEPQYHNRLDSLKDDFKLAQSKGNGSEKLDDVALAAVEGKVATLLLEQDRILPGRIDGTTGLVTAGNLTNPEADDILDDLGTIVENNGGQVLLIPAKHMATNSGLAAIYRY